MTISLRDLLTLPSFESVKVIAGKESIHNRINWFYLAETLPDIKDLHSWMNKDDLLFVTGYHIAQGNYTLYEVIIEAIKNGLSGVLIFVGNNENNTFITNISEDIIDLCRKHQFPLISIPWYVKYTSMSREISRFITEGDLYEKSASSLIDNLLFMDGVSRESIMRQAEKLSLDTSKPYGIGAIKIKNFQLYLSTLSDQTPYVVEVILDDLRNRIIAINKKYGINAIVIIKSDMILSLIEGGQYPLMVSQAYQSDVANVLTCFDENLDFMFALGRIANDFYALSSSYHQAISLIKYKAANMVGRAVYHYDDLGIFKILNELDRPTLLIEDYPYLIKPILHYDNTHQSEILRTLDCYLRCGKSLSTAADELFIHRNTVKYRIDKVKSITHLNLNDMEVCFNLMFEIKIYKFMKERGLIND